MTRVSGVPMHEMSLIVHPGKCCGLACLYADFSVSSFGAVK